MRCALGKSRDVEASEQRMAAPNMEGAVMARDEQGNPFIIVRE